MRADRLLSILMLLQRRKRMTAVELAAGHEVSVRTILRDVNALSASGVPVYTERGPHGGVRLVEDYRTNLTGLTADEGSALLALQIPEPLASTPFGQKLKLALLKVMAALPGRAQGSPWVYVDWLWWGEQSVDLPALQLLYQAVSESRRVRIRFQFFERAAIDQEVEPYGLVTKGGRWYMVYAIEGTLRWKNLADLLSVEMLPGTFSRQEDFDLAEYWKSVCSQQAQESLTFECELLAQVRVLPLLERGAFGIASRIVHAGEVADKPGWLKVSACFDHFFTARTMLLGLGSAVRVLEPKALRLSVLDYAEQAKTVNDQQ